MGRRENENKEFLSSGNLRGLPGLEESQPWQGLQTPKQTALQ
jgi:hypothetical protein